MKLSAPILIIDKEGLIGEPLVFKLSREFPVVFVSKSPLAHIPFSKKFPTIPDNKYSHIIVINGEGEGLNYLTKIIEKAKSINSDFIFALGIHARDKRQIGRVLKAYSTSKIVLYGDIFETNELNCQAQKFGRIKISGEGLRSVYPVFVSDIADALIDIVFGINSIHSLFYLFPKHATTELSLAHMIQKANPEIGIDFAKSPGKKTRLFIPPHGKYLLDDKYPLAKKIRKIDFKKTIGNGKGVSSRGKINGFRRIPFFATWTLLFLLIAPFAFTLFFAFAGLNTLYFAKTEIDKGSLDNARSSLRLSRTFFFLGKKSADALVFQGKIIKKEKNLKNLLGDIDLGYTISKGLLQAFSSADYFTQVFNGKSKNPQDDFTKAEFSLKNAVVEFEKIRAEGKIPAVFSEEIKNIDPLIRLFSNVSGIMPNVFGLDGPKTYLVLLQNNTKLRPGGGFIESYGILKLNMGKIIDFSIHDVYADDGQLRGHIEPPFAIRRYLSSPHWYMRDSNFDIDFVKSASASSNLLYAETGEKVAGVISVDTAFVKKILGAIGSVENNFFELKSLYVAMQAKLTSDKIPYMSLMQAISDSLIQKHLIFAFNNNLQNVLTVNGWSSSMFDARAENENAINDFLGISEANLGVEKAKYFIKRQVSQRVALGDDGSILEELTINYKNESAAWPGGNYKNYLRIILPLDSEISAISIDDIPKPLVEAITDSKVYEAKKFIAPVGLEVEKTIEENKTVYGFLINVPVGKEVKIKITYNLAKKITPATDAFSYNLKLFKQPGIDVLPYSFSLTYPQKFNAVGISDGLNKNGEKAFYSGEIVKDENLIIDFAKK